MIYLIWFLRIVHILAGIFWVGGTLMMAFFIAPAVGATAEAGQKFVGHLMGNLKFSNRMSAAAGLTILAGFILYWIELRWLYLSLDELRRRERFRNWRGIRTCWLCVWHPRGSYNQSHGATRRATIPTG